MNSVCVVIYLFAVHLPFVEQLDPLLEFLQQILPLLRYLIWLDVAPPRKQAALLMKYKREVIVLTLVVSIVSLLAHKHPVDLDVVLLREPLNVFLVLTHNDLVTAYVLLVSLEIFNDLVYDPLVLRVQRLHELLSLLLALHETLGLVKQVNVHHVKVVQIVQVVVKHDMQILLYFLLRKVVDVQVTVRKTC